MIQRSLQATTIDHGPLPSRAAELSYCDWRLFIDVPGEPTRAVVATGVLSIGRQETCDIFLSQPSLSRTHASFRVVDDGMLVTDLGSRNGVLVNGTRVREAVLSPGQSALLGAVSVTARVQAGAGQLAGAPASPVAPSTRPTSASNPAMSELERLVERVAKRNLTVLLTGETGAGKEHAARGLHTRSPRREAPLRIINCAAIPASLIESTLFGHERGAFTGATTTRRGAFEEAHGGTLLLDEVGELSAPAQAALLRVLESRTVVRVGSTRELPVDVRLLAATHRDLQGMVDRGEFRLDLLHRLNAVVLRVPALRERSTEIEPLARHFMAEATKAWDMCPPAVDEAVWVELTRYAWPGNVRELRNVIERALALCDGTRLTVSDLPEHVRQAPGVAPVEPGVSAAGVAGSHRSRLREQELDAVREALERSGGNRKLAAESLQMPLRTFQRRLAELLEAQGSS